MNQPVRLSCRAFGYFLLLYPREFRGEFAAEMSAVFEAESRDAWRTRRLVGLAALWLLTLREVMTVALPMQLRNAPVVASAISLVGTSALYLALLWALDDKTDAYAYAHRWRH
ncbi:MAG: hypothetical protein ABUS49_04215 [Acidobacteriota bacterium]